MNNPTPSALRQIWVIFRKETVDNLRDRRSISSSLLTTLFMPVFMIAMIIVAGRTVMSDIVEKPLDLPVAGAEYAPGLIDYMIENNVNIQPAPADPRAAVREGNVPVVLVIQPGYGKAFSDGEPAPLQLIYDSTRSSSMPSIERARRVVEGYAQTIAQLRLYARGINPQVLSPLAIERVNVSTPQSNALMFLNVIPFLMIMTVFVGGMYVIIDATAGERERGSLEPLLINPAARWVVVLGKLLASLPFALGTLAVSLFFFGLGFNVVPLENYTGMQMNIDARVLVQIFCLAVPMILLASSMQMVVASFTRSFKEAQTYLSFLPLVAGLPGAFLSFMPVKTTVWVALVPIFSQSVLINQIMRGETVPAANLLLATCVTVLAAVLMTILAIKLYEQETLLFGSK